LFERTSARYIKLKEDRAAGGGRAPQVRHALADAPALLSLLDVLRDAGGAGLDVDALPQVPEVAPAEPNTAAAGKAPDDWATINKNNRDVMDAFWTSKPQWKLVVTRKVLSIWKPVMEMKLKIGGARWELRQQAKVARAKQANASTADVRDYCATVAASNVHEAKFLESVRDLLGGREPWFLLQFEPEAKTVVARETGFRVVSRAGAAMSVLLYWPHELYPFKFLRLLKEPALAEEIIEEVTRHTLCRGGFVDEWVLAMLKLYPTADDLRNREFRASLALVLMMIYVGNGPVESLHAMVRRLILAASQHTHLKEFADVNSMWLLNSARRQTGFVCIDEVSGVAPAALVERAPKRKRTVMMTDGAPVKKKVRRCGGAFRAFVRWRTLGVGLQKGFKERGATLAREYRALSPAEKEEFKRRGKAATLVGRTKKARTQSSFGPRRRDEEKMRQRKWTRGLLNTLTDYDAGLEEVALMSNIELGNGSFITAQKVDTLRARLANAGRLEELRNDARSIELYQNTVGKAEVQSHAEEHVDNDFHVAPMATESGPCFSYEVVIRRR